MLYYKQPSEYIFFEQKRYDINNIPKWKDIEFVFSNEEFKSLKRNIPNMKEEIPEPLWNKMKKILMYNEKNKPIDNLREFAIKNQPKLYEYLQSGDIKKFEDFEYRNGKTILEMSKEINIESYSSMYEFFQRGEHIGNCGRTSKFMGIIFNSPMFHVGVAKFLNGTMNCTDGSHAWIETEINGKKYIVDTSMLLMIPTKLKEEIGYKTTKSPSKVEDIINYGPESDMYFNHYKELSKYSTKNKFSYTSYNENLKKLVKVKNNEIGEK